MVCLAFEISRFVSQTNKSQSASYEDDFQSR